MAQVKDFTGKRQGELTIIRRISDNPIKWECKCDCGRTVVLSHTQLKRGAHNCMDYHIHRKTDNSIAIGDKFGMLTVTDITINPKNKNRVYHCVCECGERVTRTRAGLVDAKFPNCGCRHESPAISAEMQSMIGKTYGNLTVVDVKRGKDIPELHLPEGHLELNKVFAVCKCNVCRGISYPRATALRTGAIKNCRHNQDVNLCKGRDVWKENSVYGTNLISIGGNRSVNKNNTSGCNGVSYHEKNRKWRAYITFQHKQYYLGMYENIEDAIAARKEAEERIYGNFLEWYYANHEK